jgi:hypothetical protein
MRRTSILFKIIMLLALIALGAGQALPAFAQTDEDGVIPDGGLEPLPATVEDAAAADAKAEFTPGEAGSFDAGKVYMYLPFAIVSGAEAASAVAPAATWQTLLYDEFCSFPSGWTTYDYNATGRNWVYATVDGYCTARANGVNHSMNVMMWRNINLVGALNARATFRFKMGTEMYWDFFRFEYSCNGGRTYWGAPSAYSGTYGWSTVTISLSRCIGYSNVRVRFTFQTDRSVYSTAAPTVDYLRIEKYQ